MVVKQAPPPQDLLFVNFGQSLGRDLCMRSLFNVAVVLLLFFCTTPMSIFNYVGLYFSATNVGHSIFLQYMTSALVSAVNSLILLIIELFVAQEKPSCRWYYQRGVYSRCNFYLTMNMLVIPALSFAAITNIYQLIKEDAGNLLDMMKAVYFVINYIIQCVCVCSSTMGSSLHPSSQEMPPPHSSSTCSEYLTYCGPGEAQSSLISRGRDSQHKHSIR